MYANKEIFVNRIGMVRMAWFNDSLNCISAISSLWKGNSERLCANICNFAMLVLSKFPTLQSVRILNIGTDWSGQTVQAQIRLLL